MERWREGRAQGGLDIEVDAGARGGSKSCFYNQNFASVGVKIFEKLLD